MRPRTRGRVGRGEEGSWDNIRCVYASLDAHCQLPKGRRVKRYQPANLDLVSLLPPIERQYLDLYGYVVSYLYVARFSDDRWSKLTRSGKKLRKKHFVELNMVVLQKILGTRHAKRVIDNLVTWRVIECDYQYVVGKKSRSYRLTSKYADSVFVGIEYGDSFEKKLRGVREKEKSRNLDPIHTFISKQIEEHFGLNPNKALEVYNSLDLDHDKSISVGLALDRLLSRDLDFRVSSKSKRYFNTLVNLKRELRSALVIRDGSPLVEVDIANSQPFFLAFFVRSMERKRGDILEIAQHFRVDKRRVHRIAESSEFKRFCKLTATGTFYDYFCTKTGLDREGVKNQILVTFFKPMHYTTPFEVQFKKWFPMMWEVFKLLKPKGEHNKFALLLQRVESLVVIEILGSALMELEIPFIPIHDSVIVRRDDAPAVEEQLGEITFWFSGLKPKVRVKEQIDAK